MIQPLGLCRVRVPSHLEKKRTLGLSVWPLGFWKRRWDLFVTSVFQIRRICWRLGILVTLFMFIYNFRKLVPRHLLDVDGVTRVWEIALCIHQAILLATYHGEFASSSSDWRLMVVGIRVALWVTSELGVICELGLRARRMLCRC